MSDKSAVLQSSSQRDGIVFLNLILLKYLVKIFTYFCLLFVLLLLKLKLKVTNLT